jgi:hypothetical protein
MKLLLIREQANFTFIASFYNIPCIQYAETEIFHVHVSSFLSVSRLNNSAVRPEAKDGTRDKSHLNTVLFITLRPTQLEVKGKAVPLHTMEALGVRGGIAPTHSRLRH